MSLGPLMIDVEGQVLSEEERELLAHPLVGGVILFSRNYQSPQQIKALIAEIHRLRHPPLLIAVDHEGGRVQRFRQAFSWLPATSRLGMLYDRNPAEALSQAQQLGWLLATELRAVGVDLAFAPVLDLQGVSSVIGDRAFHALPAVVSQLAQRVMLGMQEAGMQAVGKHFPGHGSVEADSHVAIPIDNRGWSEIQKWDLLPFENLIKAGLAAMMTAHVIYPQVDALPASFSHRWLQEILRQSLAFPGAIISDDLSMVGASGLGGAVARAQQALQAGCDMILICNQRSMVIEVVEQLGEYHSPRSVARLRKLYGQLAPNWEDLPSNRRWLEAQVSLNL